MASLSWLVVLLCFTGSAIAADAGPLNPLDTSSPRATLLGFTETVDGIYAGNDGPPRKLCQVRSALPDFSGAPGADRSPSACAKAIRAMDVSGIPPVLQDTIPVERLLQLKEILDRIQLPPLANIPDQETMARLALRRWRLPGTEIDFVQVQDGPRAGEYLVSAETVDRLPEFYAEVANLPYKPGAAKQLNEVFRTLSTGRYEHAL